MNSRIVFTPSEKQCLLDLINQYPAVASISTNHLQLGEKKNAWAKLTDDFNSIADNPKRTQAQLRKCWDNIKTKRKLELCEEKRSRLKTGGGRLSPSHSQEHHPADSALDLPTNIELSFCNDSDRTICHSYDDAAVPSTSSAFSMPWTDQSTEVPVFDIPQRMTPKENYTPQQLPDSCKRRVIPKRDLMRSGGQVVRDEAEVRCRRNLKLIAYDEEIHKIRMETAREQLETAQEQLESAREQLKSARLETKLKEFEVQKAQAELETALARNSS